MTEKENMVNYRELEKIIKGHTSFLHNDSVNRNITDEASEFPKVSIITPSYNQGEFIERTILSVLNQDWPNIEYIIVDGASTDNTREIIEKYEQHLVWWVSEPDKGQTNAINKGIKMATGKYITWICSDDILLPGAITKLVTILEKNPQIGMVFGGVAFLDEYDMVTKTLAYTDMTLEKLLYHKHSTIAQPSSLLRRKSLDDAGGLDESLTYCMDYDFWIRLHRIAGSINLDDSFLSGYRLHTRSKTVGSYPKMALEKIRVNRKYTKNIINKVIYKHYWYIIEGCIKSFMRRGKC
jgi:glycosyltransferase involved in cell wall biosynthesis